MRRIALGISFLFSISAFAANVGDFAEYTVASSDSPAKMIERYELQSYDQQTDLFKEVTTYTSHNGFLLWSLVTESTGDSLEKYEQYIKNTLQDCGSKEMWNSGSVRWLRIGSKKIKTCYFNYSKFNGTKVWYADVPTGYAKYVKKDPHSGVVDTYLLKKFQN